ncbi:hypothetical protein Tco_1233960, partial [Tanacetum coccineum]
MLKKFGLEESKLMKTPMSFDTKLTKDEECELVDSTKYRGMIGSLLYITTSRSVIMFSVCLCARFQEAPKTSYLKAVKRIFQYINGTTYLGLWYPKGTGVETVVYANSDHAGDYVDRKSTSGVAGYGGAQNRVGNANPGQARQIKCYNCNAQENRVALDEDQLLFIADGQDNAIDEDVDEQPVQDLALNVDNVF